MARYKYIDTQPRLVPVDLARQFLLGTFEHAMNHLLDRAIDLSGKQALTILRNELPAVSARVRQILTLRSEVPDGNRIQPG